MKRSFFGLAAAGGLLALGLARPAAGQETKAGTDSPTAYTALRLVGKTLGVDAINRVVEVTGRDGKPQPAVWKLVLKEGEGSREIEVVNGKITTQRPLSRPAAGAAIKLPDLNLDSSGAFDATDAQAKKVHVRFDSINYTLRTSDKTGKPLWTLALLDAGGGVAGTMKIAANSGAIASVEGRIAAGPAPAPAGGKPAADGTPAAKPAASSHAAPSPKPAAAVAASASPTPRHEVRDPPVTTSTATVAAVATVPVQTTVVDVPDAGGPVPPPEESGGFFTRTGRTLDHTSQNVNQTLDHAGQDVTHSLRHAGATIQRFFTGRSNPDDGARPAPPAPANAPPD